MHVPYSMDDSEPDLYGSLGGRYSDEPDDYPPPPNPPMYVFHNEIELAQSDVFRRMLLMALKCKERQIDELRQEILNLMELK